ncbi:MAG: hypothetical protein GKR96_05200 [Gammaproteobacteria bacterium]|nr:hypothetical protein [Gammaproteobacteria bacterium]
MNWVKDLRNEFHYKQSALGKHCGSKVDDSSAMVSEWEQRGNIPDEHMDCVAEFLGMTSEKLVEFKNNFQYCQDLNRRSLQRRSALAAVLRELLEAGVDVLTVPSAFRNFDSENGIDSKLETLSESIEKDIQKASSEDKVYPGYFESLVAQVGSLETLDGPIRRLIESSIAFYINIPDGDKLLKQDMASLDQYFPDELLADAQLAPKCQSDLIFSVHLLNKVARPESVAGASIEIKVEKTLISMAKSGAEIQLPFFSENADAAYMTFMTNLALSIGEYLPEGLDIENVSAHQRFLRQKFDEHAKMSKNSAGRPIGFSFTKLPSSVVKRIQDEFPQLFLCVFEVGGEKYVHADLNASSLSHFILLQTKRVNERAMSIEKKQRNDNGAQGPLSTLTNDEIAVIHQFIDMSRKAGHAELGLEVEKMIDEKLNKTESKQVLDTLSKGSKALEDIAKTAENGKTIVKTVINLLTAAYEMLLK